MAGSSPVKKIAGSATLVIPSGGAKRRGCPQTDFLGDSLTVFDIGGNKFRLVVNMRYRRGKVYVRHVLTHAEYEKLSKVGRL
jgi:mRNA-degrading endonuclease HigB of HigAB toxin-antitoxin module